MAIRGDVRYQKSRFRSSWRSGAFPGDETGPSNSRTISSRSIGSSDAVVTRDSKPTGPILSSMSPLGGGGENLRDAYRRALAKAWKLTLHTAPSRLSMSIQFPRTCCGFPSLSVIVNAEVPVDQARPSPRRCTSLALPE
jgi:hypothetical protein